MFLSVKDRTLDQVTVVDPFLNRFHKEDKTGILDVLVHTTSGKVINVEIQVEPFTGMRERILFYLARLVWSQIKRGRDYTSLKQTVSIVICDFVFLPEEPDYCNYIDLRNQKSHTQFTDLLGIVILELPKVPTNRDSPLWPWLRFLKCQTKEELDMLTKQNPEVRKVVAEYKKLSWSERRELIAIARDKQRRDRHAIIETRVAEGIAERTEKILAEGKEKGLAEGMEKGMEKGSRQRQIEIARNLKAIGLSTEQISVTTALSPEEIAAL